MTSLTTDKIDGYIQKFLDGLAEGHRNLEASFAASKAEYERQKAETDAKIAAYEAETARIVAASKAEYDRQKAETDAKMAESDAKCKAGFEELRKSQRKTESMFNTQWGRLVEALVNNQVIPLLKGWGIPVHQTSQRISGSIGNRNFEFDIIAENGDTIVVIEVKTTLRPEDVREFLDELDHFKQWLPRYSDMKVYGAVAFLHNVSEAANVAAKRGLFTILATGSSATITNPPEFKPKEF